jgi:acetylornithine aminotransferase/acetylornithine/N-succinyldiaminopimelate aminotransferase
LVRDFPQHVVAVRGRGYLVGVQMANDPAPWLGRLRERGLLAVGSGNNVIRLLPPLTASAEELARATEIFRATLAAQAQA